MSYKQVYTLRHRRQQQLDATVPIQPMRGGAFEVDELYQNVGETRDPTSQP